MIVCLARGCKKEVPVSALKQGDPYCSSSCFQKHHGIDPTPSGMYGPTKTLREPGPLTLMQQARLEVDRQARITATELAASEKIRGRYAHLVDDDDAS